MSSRLTPSGGRPPDGPPGPGGWHRGHHTRGTPTHPHPPPHPHHPQPPAIWVSTEMYLKGQCHDV